MPKSDLLFGDVMLRRGVHVMVIDPKPSDKKGDWGGWFAGIQLTPNGTGYFIGPRSPEIAFYRRGECKKVEE